MTGLCLESCRCCAYNVIQKRPEENKMSVGRDNRNCLYCGQDYVDEKHFVFDTALVRNKETGAVYKKTIVWPCLYDYINYEGLYPISKEDIENALRESATWERKSISRDKSNKSKKKRTV
jgi:hypothetical protein